jgi:Mg-chelatase subunit ChlD
VGAYVEEMKAGGSTPMHAGLQLALDHFQQESATDRERLVILTSDGQPDRTEATKEIATALKERARIVTVGIGDDVSDSLMMEIATTPNDYHFARDPEDLEGIFDRIAELYIKEQESHVP